MLRRNHELHQVKVCEGLLDKVVMYKSGHKIFRHLHASELQGT